MECLTVTGAASVSPQFGRFPPKSPPYGPQRRRVTAAAGQSSDEINLSVLRFTLGIPGLDESYLPRWIGVAFGSLVVLNHFLTLSPSPAQLRSEALGLCLAAFSTTLPYIGRFLKGADRVDRSSTPEGNNQIFVLSEDIPVTLKEDLAWGSYVLLRNTNTMSVLIAVRDAFCIRGYWNTPQDASKAQILELFESRIKQIGFLDLKEALYFPQNTDDSQLEGMLPKGTLSLLVQPVNRASDPVVTDDDRTTRTTTQGFVLLASSANYAYSERDRAWIRAVALKFQALLDPFSEFPNQ